ncbi:hypothetical protein EDB89DRAFT_1957452 [Lactarius sanguifluus]|nr:hypothetical protein EDB89DRAFT_1957452 [Lactarius sanguifluus]
MSSSPHPFSLPRPRRPIVVRHSVSALLCFGFLFLRLSPFDCLSVSIVSLRVSLFASSICHPFPLPYFYFLLAHS